MSQVVFASTASSDGFEKDCLAKERRWQRSEWLTHFLWQGVRCCDSCVSFAAFARQLHRPIIADCRELEQFRTDLEMNRLSGLAVDVEPHRVLLFLQLNHATAGSETVHVADGQNAPVTDLRPRRAVSSRLP